jgi:mannose-6-phosphate isomerase-like protein (cupin superfamily)
MELHRLRDLSKTDKTYHEFLRTRDLSMGIYRLPAGTEDRQQPHPEEEIYFVSAGRARFLAGQHEVSIAAGDILFVPASEPHKFQDIEEDLELLVFFAPAEGSRNTAKP